MVDVGETAKLYPNPRYNNERCLKNQPVTVVVGLI